MITKAQTVRGFKLWNFRVLSRGCCPFQSSFLISVKRLGQDEVPMFSSKPLCSTWPQDPSSFHFEAMMLIPFTNRINLNDSNYSHLQPWDIDHI